MPTDPLHELARPSSPARPNPAFAISLWRRVEQEIGMTNLADLDRLTTGQLGILHIRVPDADRAFAFYRALLDWESDPYLGEEFKAHYITNTRLLTVLTENADVPGARLWFAVTDLSRALEQAAELGGEIGEVGEDGAYASLTDGQGSPLGLWVPRGDHRIPDSRHQPKGEVGYVTLHVPEAERAMAFYEGLVGWRFQEPRGSDYHHVDNTELSIGLYGGHPSPHVEWYVRVADLASLVPRVNELGGVAGQVTESRSGLSATCTDEQGMTLRLWQPAPGY